MHFYPKGSARRVDGQVAAIASTRARQLDWPALADRYGGPIATAKNADGLAPRLPVFHVVIQLGEPPSPSVSQLREAPGEVQISGDRRSLATGFGTWLAATFLRESGF